MAFDLNLARTVVEFTVDEQDKEALATPVQRANLLKALLENKNLQRTKNVTNNFSKEDRLRLAEHISANTRRLLLTNAEIKVRYTCVDDPKTIRNENFRFDDPDFHKANKIIFLKFKIADGVSDADIKLCELKDLLFSELAKCKHLQSCHFYGNINKPSSFLNKTRQDSLDKMIYRNNIYRSKYKFNWTRNTGIAFGLAGLTAMVIPGWGLLSGLLSAAFLFVGGVNVGSGISFLREKFLFKVALKHLQALKQNKAPANDAIKESLVAGLESKQWKGYFNSFLNLKTYSPTNYQAYATGLYAGENRLKEQKDAITKLRG